MSFTNSPKVGLLVTCLVDLYRPSVGFASIELLTQSGCEVEVPKSQTCCGQPAFNSGDKRSAIDFAKRIVQIFESYDYVVGPSGSCIGTIKTHYPELLKTEAGWHERICRLAEKTFELTSFLREVMNFEVADAKMGETITYHDSCAGLRELGVKEQPRELLSHVEGLKLTEMTNSEVCCGFGGTFCVKYPEISTKLVDDKLKGIEDTQASAVIGGDMGCLLNISGRLKRLGKDVKVYHVAEVLANMTDKPAIGDGESN